jgi:hypothetical protein
MMNPDMEQHIAKAAIQILRERLAELETMRAAGDASEDTFNRLAFVRKLLVQFDARDKRMTKRR